MLWEPSPLPPPPLEDEEIGYLLEERYHCEKTTITTNAMTIQP